MNGLIEYLGRRARFDEQARAKLIELSEMDVRLYKPFLTAFTSSIDESASNFAAAVRSKHYMCPNLPSFIALWDQAEEAGGRRQLERLRRIAQEIRYEAYASAEIDNAGEGDDPAAAPLLPAKAAAKASSPVVDGGDVPDVVEVVRSGQKGKIAFLHPDGHPCSTEEAACGWLEQRGFRTLRGEVQFWQAMFALAFWEEIFEGAGGPSGMNDIPMDLFSGVSFYDVRKAAIDVKAARIARADVESFIGGQLRRYGGYWTRILYDGPRGEFGYRRVLESAEVAEFLRLVPPDVFAKIVHRIATNPTENRSGLPDYTAWTDGRMCFVEVKGIREQIREGQQAWLAWMQAEGIPAKVMRVKGIVKV